MLGFAEVFVDASYRKRVVKANLRPSGECRYSELRLLMTLPDHKSCNKEGTENRLGEKEEEKKSGPVMLFGKYIPLSQMGSI